MNCILSLEMSLEHPLYLCATTIHKMKWGNQVTLDNPAIDGIEFSKGYAHSIFTLIITNSKAVTFAKHMTLLL